MADLARIHLITGGRFHDFDLARLVLLEIMAEYEFVRATCAGDFRDLGVLDRCKGLVIYTCDKLPSTEETAVLTRFVTGGGRILALHATNAPIEFTDGPVVVASGVHIPGLVKAPSSETAPNYMALLGSRFRAHLAGQEFTVNVQDSDHELTRGLSDFKVTDEPYVSEILSNVRVLLSARYKGDAPGYELGRWEDDAPRPQLYLRELGLGSVAYLTLGHSCGRYDLIPMVQETQPVRGPWDNPTFRELLRRAVAWMAHATPAAQAA
jgi:type 1 glutamine amidotransferase